MTISSITHIASCCSHVPLPNTASATLLEEVSSGLFDIINAALGISALIHLIAPIYSPILWLRGCELYDGTQFVDSPQLRVTVKKVEEKIETYRQKMGISSPVSLMISNGDFRGFAQGIAGVPGFSSPAIATGINELTYIEEIGDKELNGVLCHELAHVKNCDTLKFLALMATSTLISAAVAPIFMELTGLYYALYVVGDLALLLVPLFLLSKPIEKQADLDAAEALGSGKGLASFFERFQKPNDDDGCALLHPPLRERVAYLKDFDRQRLVT